jgi:F-type H+-transporting ATPase subunit b
MDMIPIHLIAAAASSSSGAPEKTGGMPQISQLAENGFVSSQIFWLLIVFGLVYVVVGRMMAPKVVATVEQRDKVVADDLAAAEAARTAADAAEEQWRAQENAAREQAKRKLAEARAAGSKATEQRLGAANAELDARTAEAEQRIAASRTAAMSEIDAVAAEAARDMVLRVAGTDVEISDARKAVESVRHGG